MRFKNSSIILIPALSMLLASTAGAVPPLTPKYPFPELAPPPGKGSFTAYPMITAFLMGVIGYDNSPATVNKAIFPGDMNNPSTQDKLLDDCVNLSSTWPSNCSPDALAKVVSLLFAPQKWLVPMYSASKRNVAIANQISAMRYYKSPVAIPLFGHVDHWGTLFEITTNANYTDIDKVKYRDSGTPIGEDPNVIATDSELTPYVDDPVEVVSGLEYAQTYYKILNGFILEPTEPMSGKYIFAYDPPEGTRPLETTPRLTFQRGTPLVEPGEMTVDLAPTLVWDALDEEGLLQDRQLHAVAAATPGDAWLVHGRKASGAPWDFIVVPMYDEEMKKVVALVGLDADDGGFERLSFLGTPRALDLPGPREAALRAKRLLQPGESLGAGVMTWDPACGGEYCRQPLLPYHEFAITNQRGGDVGRITVPLGGFAASRR